MTEEFWQNYKKNKDLAQPNQLWRGVSHNNID